MKELYEETMSQNSETKTPRKFQTFHCIATARRPNGPGWAGAHQAVSWFGRATQAEGDDIAMALALNAFVPPEWSTSENGGYLRR